MNLVARDRQVLWHPCAQMQDYDQFPPYEVVAAQGCWLEFADGHRAIDAISSWWCKSLGHRHPDLMQALRRQSEQFDHVLLANTTNAGVVRLSERLLAMANGHGPEHWSAESKPGHLPGHFGKVFYADNGSTAMEIALKLALQAQQQRGQGQRTKFAALANGYHGETVATLALGDCGLYGEPYRPLMFDVTMLHNLPYRSGPNDPLWQDASAEWPAIEAQLNAQADELAAISYEPILQGAGGMLLYSPDLLRRLRAWADAHDVFLIADEIASGFGRCGTMLAHEHADCLPDLVAISKGLTGGVLPFSAVLIPDQIYDLFLGEYFSGKAFMHSNTHTGNALGVAVANAALDVYARDRILDEVAQQGPLLQQGLADIMTAHPQLPLGNLRGVGMVAAFEITGQDPQARTGYQVYQAAIRRGAWLRCLGDTIYLLPPLTITADEIEQLITIVAASLDEVLAER